MEAKPREGAEAPAVVLVVPANELAGYVRIDSDQVGFQVPEEPDGLLEPT